MKICLVGPSYPFRGGIAHHTTLLYKNLRKRHDVAFYAFKRQYPRWMFPGRTDVDRSGFAIKENGTEYILDSLNPLTWWNVFRKIKKANPDIVIFPWWVSFWTPQFLAISLLASKLTQAKILFICHNIIPHELRLMDGLCTRLVLNRGDFFIVHSDEDMENLKKIVPNAIAKKAYHPLYDIFNFGNMTKKIAQRRLGVKGRILLFFGFVRPYKGLRYLIEAVPFIRERFDVTLLVVGEFWEKKDRYLQRIEELGISDGVMIIDEYIPNEDVEIYFTASDVVVLPYVAGTGSGIAQLAFGLNKPIIVTNVGSLPEIVADGSTGFIVEPRNPKEIADAVIRFYEEKREIEFARKISKEQDKFSWQGTVDVIGDFFEI